MKVIVSFSVDTHLVDRLRLACMHKRVSFSQYAEFALESAPPLTEELAIQLARRRHGLPPTPPSDAPAPDKLPEAAD